VNSHRPQSLHSLPRAVPHHHRGNPDGLAVDDRSKRAVEVAHRCSAVTSGFDHCRHAPRIQQTFSSMSPDPIISDFKQRKLHIDFFEMSLVQNKPGEEAISYKGKGYIQQTDDDVLTFKLYANETQNTDFVSNLTDLNKIKSGEVYPDDSYYTLSGIAADGTAWNAGHVLPDCRWNAQHKNPIIHGNHPRPSPQTHIRPVLYWPQTVIGATRTAPIQRRVIP